MNKSVYNPSMKNGIKLPKLRKDKTPVRNELHNRSLDDHNMQGGIDGDVESVILSMNNSRRGKDSKRIKLS